MRTHVKVFHAVWACVCTVCIGTSLLCGRECVHRGSRVSHLDASSCDGNRNGQKSEADTANGSLKLGGTVTPASHSSFRSLYPRYLSSRLLFLKSFINLHLSLQRCLPPLSPLLPFLPALRSLALVAVSPSPHIFLCCCFVPHVHQPRLNPPLSSSARFISSLFAFVNGSRAGRRNKRRISMRPLGSVKFFKFASSPRTELLQASKYIIKTS